MKDLVFERVEKGIEAIRSGKMVILTDHSDRENEGDLVLAAQFATPETINFMARYGRGLICVAMESTMIDRLNLPPMVSNNESSLGTAFTVSIGSKRGITTGISAYDRAHTVQTAIAENATRDDLVVPGHVFPLRARDGGVLIRAGHTEGSVDLARLAGLRSAAVICEILKEDGSMAREQDLIAFSRQFEIPLLSIADLILYRFHKDASLVADLGVIKQTQVNGKSCRVHAFRSLLDQQEHWAWMVGDPSEKGTLVRVQTENFEEDVVNVSLGLSKHSIAESLKKMSDYGSGVFLYLRGQNMEKEDQILRQYGLGAQILKTLGVKRMTLLTDSPKRLAALEGFGLELAGTEKFSEGES